MKLSKKQLAHLLEEEAILYNIAHYADRLDFQYLTEEERAEGAKLIRQYCTRLHEMNAASDGRISITQCQMCDRRRVITTIKYGLRLCDACLLGRWVLAAKQVFLRAGEVSE